MQGARTPIPECRLTCELSAAGARATLGTFAGHQRTERAMANDFEDHCWKDKVPADGVDIYSHYARKTFVGPSPALLAIDLYELAFQGWPEPVAKLHKTYSSNC